jgi:hypothetical protein
MSDETETPPVDEEAEAPAAEEAEPSAGEAEPDAKAAEKKPKKAKPAAKAKSKPAAKTKGKGKGGGKRKGKKGAGDGLSIASSPRAAAQVRRAKGWGGLFGFGLALYISWQAGVPLAAGIAGYMLAWACMVTIWRQLLVAEVRTMAERRQPPGAVPSGAAPGPTDDAGAKKLPE